MIKPEDVLSAEEFEALDASDQAAYLKLLADVDAAWSLTGKQLLADSLADQVKELLYGGAAGGGKSEWILHRAWRKSREIAGHRTLILRTSFPELRRSIISRSIVLYGTHTPPDEMPVYKVADKEWHFPNGSVIEFGYCASEEDTAQFLSAEYDMICFDEATQFLPEQYDLIRSRARTTASKIKRGARPHVIAATNPGQRGHAYFKATFVDTTDLGRNGIIQIIRDTEDNWRAPEEGEEFDPRKARTIAFVPSTVMDNPHIDPEYVNHLMTLPEKLQRKYLFGDWDLPEGKFFDEFARERMDDEGNMMPWHVIDPFPIPDSWYKVQATDWGFAAPFCTLWIAWDPDGRAYVYREAYKARLNVSDQAQMVATMTPVGEKINKSVADPACWAKRDTLTIADQWKNLGWRNFPAKNDRLAGWMRVREYLRPGHDGFPSLQIFSSCTNLVRTMPNMFHDANKPEDLDTDLEDHAVDALRYGLMLRPLASHQRKEGPLSRAQRHFDKMTRRNKNRTSLEC